MRLKHCNSFYEQRKSSLYSPRLWCHSTFSSCQLWTSIIKAVRKYLLHIIVS